MGRDWRGIAIDPLLHIRLFTGADTIVSGVGTFRLQYLRKIVERFPTHPCRRLSDSKEPDWKNKLIGDAPSILDNTRSSE